LDALAMAPLHIKDNIFIAKELGAPPPAEMISHIEALLLSVDARNIREHSNQVIFDGGPTMPAMNTHILLPIDHGVISVSDTGSGILIDYDLRLTVLFLLTSILGGLLGSACFFEFHRSPVYSLAAWLLSWAWLFGANCLLTWYRFPRWLGDGIRRLACLKA
jgi:hypothetical protein